MSSQMKLSIFILFFHITFCCVGQKADTTRIIDTLDLMIKAANDTFFFHSKEFDTSGRFFFAIFTYQECALDILENAKSVSEKELGKNSEYYGRVCLELGSKLILSGYGEIRLAEIYLLESKAILERNKNSAEYKRCLDNLKSLYSLSGDKIKYNAISLEWVSILERELQFGGYTDIDAMCDVALNYEYEDNYSKAEFYYNKIIEAKTELDCKLVRFPKLSAADFFMKTNKLEKAERLYLEILSCGLQNFDNRFILDKLAILYNRKENLEKAYDCKMESKKLWELYFGKDAIERAQLDSYWAHLGLEDLGKDDIDSRCLNADIYLNNRILWDKLFSKDFFEKAGFFTHYILMQYEFGNNTYLDFRNIIDKQVEEFKNSLDLTHKFANKYKNEFPFLSYLQMNWGNQKFGPFGLDLHPDYYTSLRYYRMLFKYYPEYEKLFIFSKINKRIILKGTYTYSEKDLYKLVNKIIESRLQVFPFDTLPDHNNFKIFGHFYDNSLFYKGFVMNVVSHIKSNLNSDSKGIQSLKLLRSLYDSLAYQYSKASPDLNNIHVLEDEINLFEEFLAYTMFKINMPLKVFYWQEIQAKLKPKEVAIEFIQCQFLHSNPGDNVFYAALVLKPDSLGPELIPLFEENELSLLLNSLKNGSFRGINQLYSVEKQNKLYNMVWRPLEKALNDVSCIYYSPTGLLNRVNLGAIQLSNNFLSSEKYILRMLGSTKQLVDPQHSEIIGKEAYVLGGVRYDRDSNSTVSPSSNSDIAQHKLHSFEGLPYYIDSTSRGTSWEYLRNSKNEALKIAKILKHKKYSVVLDTGFLASEESFKKLGLNGPSPRIILASTHGFFYPEEDSSYLDNRSYSISSSEMALKKSKHPMIRSGLILAGANEFWTIGGAPKNEEDGILTAYEISQLNLSNTELVVLSACETGLGDIKDNEGVYGLQRAFKIAGAKYIIMSLWKVNDYATSELMTEFFDLYDDKGLDIPDAFRTAQIKLKNKYPDFPYLWAGFVLAE